MRKFMLWILLALMVLAGAAYAEETAVAYALNGFSAARTDHEIYMPVDAAAGEMLLRIPAAYIFSTVFGLGLFGIGLGAPVASAGSIVFILCFLASGKWRVNKVIKR